MSDNELNFSEETTTEGHNLKPKQERQKRAAYSDNDNAALLSDESSGDHAEDLVLEYTDVFAPSGKILDSVAYEEGNYESTSDKEISGFTEDGAKYEDQILDPTVAEVNKQLNEPPNQRTEILVQIDDEQPSDENAKVGLQHVGEDEALGVSGTSKMTHVANTGLSNSEISKIVEVLSSHTLSDSKSENIRTSDSDVVQRGGSIKKNSVKRKTKKKNNLDIFNDDSSSFSSDVEDSIEMVNGRTNVLDSHLNNGDVGWDDGSLMAQQRNTENLENTNEKFELDLSPVRRKPKKHTSRNSKESNEKLGGETKRNNQETDLTETVSTYGESSHTLANDSVNTKEEEEGTSLATGSPQVPVVDASPVDRVNERRTPGSNKRGRSRTSRPSKRTRHRIYLDDPDVHQYIADHASMLRRYMEDVQSGKIPANKRKNRIRPISQDEIGTDSRDSRGMRRKQSPDSHKASLPNVSFSGQKDVTPSNLRQAKSLGSVGPYDGHGKRGRNLITRIQNGSESSTSDEDDDDYTDRTIGDDSIDVGSIRHRTDKEWDELFDICPECGERHPPDDEYPLDQEICPDCGVPHNPYQHQPSGATQDPPETQDTLPSIEGPHTKDELSDGVKYYMKYLGSTQVTTQHPVTKETRMQQAQEAYSRIKVPDEDTQPSTDVEVVISTERIKVFDREQKFADVMMDHALRTVCFICDMGDILVLMARRLTADHMANLEALNKGLNLQNLMADKEKRTSKNMCHVFECEEASKVAKAIGQAFNMAYRHFLKTNGISHENVEETEYCHVLESQRIVGQDLDLLTNNSNARDVVVQKKRGDSVGVMLLESGWGSMLPTVFIAHIANYSPAARLGGQLSVGDHLLACNGASLVGLPLSECNQALRNTRSSTRVILRVVSCPPVVDVVVSRPDTKYQLGFSVQNGTICSLLRGGIAERGGVRVGHRIIEINGDSVVAKSHQHIVDVLANTVGEISLKTMPVAMYRLMVGVDQPQHV